MVDGAEAVPEFYCERCGGIAGGAHAAGGFCLSCRLHVCAGCYGDASARCARCGRLPLRPLGAARQALSVLREAPGELRALSTDRGNRWRRDHDSSIERYLLGLKVETARRAARHALAGLDGDNSPRAVAVRNDLAVATAEIDALMPAEADVRTAPVPQEPHRVRVLAGMVGAVVAMAVGAVLYAFGDQPATGIVPPEATERAAPTGGVAGGQASPAPTSGAVSPRPVDAVLATFDDLVMEAPLGDAWASSGGVDTAGVAAFPSPFDRSLRLQSSSVPEHLCRLLDDRPTAALRVEVDVLLDSLHDGARLVELRHGERSIAGVTLEASGRVTFTHADTMITSAAPWEPEQWYRVSILLGSGEQPELSIVVTDLGDGTIEAQYEAPAGADAGAVDRICFGLPASADGDLYLDNLAIR